jgi:aminoglycoside phosphotransferase family enzyme
MARDDRALPDHIPGLLAPGVLGDAAPELVQTHASYVLLAGERVYKLKKPLDLGFLDYTTLARRRAACEAELALNRRLTSGVYLEVAPVVRRDGGFALGGAGEPVDFAVVMRRLPAERMMDRLVERDAVTPAMLERLASHLAAFYANAATGPEVEAGAQSAALLANWQENFAQTLPFVDRTIDARAYSAIAAAVYRELVRLRPLWQERIARGYARDCHGDLRLSAVCFDEAIQVYDCIEFNERFRDADVAADVAFLTMDLDGHGRPDLADEFLAGYVAASGDTTLTATLPFYRCYRAYVRGKVDGFLLDEYEVSPEQKAVATAAARARFALAHGYVRATGRGLTLVVGRDAQRRRALAVATAGRLGAVYVEGDSTGAEVERWLRRRVAVVLALPEAGALPWNVRRVIAGDADQAPPGALRVPSEGSLREALTALYRLLAPTPRPESRR